MTSFASAITRGTVARLDACDGSPPAALTALLGEATYALVILSGTCRWHSDVALAMLDAGRWREVAPWLENRLRADDRAALIWRAMDALTGRAVARMAK